MSVMNLKQKAALHALQYVSDGMHIGLGTGSTTRLFIQALGERWNAGDVHGLKCVATSQETILQAQLLRLPLISLAELISDGQAPILDLAVDGADEVDPNLDLIKGLGRAALREKIVEMHARHFVVIVDETKLVERLGRGPLPVEIIPFEHDVTIQWLQSLGCRAELWMNHQGDPWVTDNYNWLARCWFDGGIVDPYALASTLNQRPGVVEHGLFLKMAHEVVVAGSDGIRILRKS
jgi:ribose 5-phosphate isomerase A